MSQPADDSSSDRAQSDPLLLFADEPVLAAAPVLTPAIPPDIDRPASSPELEAIRARVEATEKSLRDSRREVATLKREMATLVTAAGNYQRSQPVRWPATAAATIGILVIAGALLWQFRPAAAPVSAPAVEHPIESDEPTLGAAAAPVAYAAETTPFTRAVAPTPLPARRSLAPSQDSLLPEPRIEYVGTLSVDAVPAGSEVYINRKRVGQTPVRLTGLRAGSHLVWIERAGYRLFTRVVLVPADQVTRVSVALEPTETR